MTDSTPAILTAILLILAFAGFLGFKDLHTEELERQMSFWESRWEQAVEARKEKRQFWCVNYVSAWSSNVGLDYDPKAVMRVYHACL